MSISSTTVRWRVAPVWIMNAVGADSDIPGVVSHLAQGGKVDLKAEHLPKLLDHAWNNSHSVDIAGVSVPHTNLFSGHLGIPRNEMPVITKDHEADFLAELHKEEVTHERGQTSPHTLSPTQSQLDARISGGILGAMREGKYDHTKPIIISKDNHVLDGHHRWVAGVAHEIENPGYTMPTVRINLPIKHLLKRARDFNKAHSIQANEHGQSKAFGEAKNSIEQQPGAELHRHDDGGRNIHRVLDRLADYDAERHPLTKAVGKRDTQIGSLFDQAFDSQPDPRIATDDQLHSIQWNDRERPLAMANRKLPEGTKVGSRLNLNLLGRTKGKHAVQSVHAGSWSGPVVGYDGAVTLKNAQFNVSQAARAHIAAGRSSKTPMASADGSIKHTGHSLEGVEVRFNPKTSHLFTRADNGWAVKGCDEATIHGHRAYCRGNIEYWHEHDAPKPLERLHTDAKYSPEAPLAKAIDRRGGKDNLSLDMDATERTSVPGAPWGAKMPTPGPQPKSIALNPLSEVKPLVSNLDATPSAPTVRQPHHPPTTSAAYDAVKERERAWTRAKVGAEIGAEIGAAVGHDGTVHGHYISGKPDRIDFTESQANRIRNIPHGAILTHTHPEGQNWEPGHTMHKGGSFSLSDLGFAANVGAREMRAVTPVHTYSIKPGIHGDRFDAATYQKIKRAHELRSFDVRTQQQALITQGKLDPQDASAEHHHLVRKRSLTWQPRFTSSTTPSTASLSLATARAAPT